MGRKLPWFKIYDAGEFKIIWRKNFSGASGNVQRTGVCCMEAKGRH